MRWDLVIVVLLCLPISLVVPYRRATRSAERGVFACALRPVGGTERRWQYGTASLAAGEITFQPRKKGTAARHLRLVGSVGEGRAPSFAEWWRIHPWSRVFRLTTPEGDFDWSVLAPDPALVMYVLEGHTQARTGGSEPA